jgi:hypothetical protein
MSAQLLCPAALCDQVSEFKDGMAFTVKVKVTVSPDWAPIWVCVSRRMGKSARKGTRFQANKIDFD